MHNIPSHQLTPSQRKAVSHKEGPLLVVAGPGSGKTRVITYRIAALIDSGIKPYNICAITFTNKAADEMRQRAAALGASGRAHISTFHSLCVRILRQYADKADIKPNFSIYDESEQSKCIKQAVKDCELDTTNFPPARMLEKISDKKNKLVDVNHFKAQADAFGDQTLAKIYARYQRILAEHNALDFDDLLMKTAFLLEGWPEVCRELGDRFRFLLIDEYQDTNHAQYRIAKALVSQHNNICATGDPDQSIYRWRGADLRNILDFEKDWPDAVIVKLEENFRSTANILQGADSLIACNQIRKQKTLIAKKPRARYTGISVFEDEEEEAQAVAQRIKELTEQGASLKDIAVFYRTNAMSRVLEEAFIRNNIPYQIVRGVEFYNRKEIRDLLAYLKVIANPDDEIALLRIINTPARGIGNTTIDRIRAYAVRSNISLSAALKSSEHIESLPKAAKAKIAAFVDMLEGFKKDMDGEVAPLAERVFVESGLKESLQAAGAEGENAIENVNELINGAARYDQQAEEPSLIDYLQQISLFSDVDRYDTASERVALMTLHAAKGLEFENVFIIGLEEGLLPHERRDSDRQEDPQESLEEERRLFFVGITRAKTGLYISCARYRKTQKTRGQSLRTIPSQFLFELGSDFAEPAQEDQSVFFAGEVVRHKSFGVGRVKEFTDVGENSVVVVEFNSGQIKSLMVKYASLVKINI